MKFGQLIEYNMKNMFIEKSYNHVVQELVADPYLKN